MCARRITLLLVAASALVVACGGGSGDGSDGRLLVARLDGIYERGIEGADETLLLGPEETNSYLMDPAVSPDGSMIAFVVQPPPKTVGAQYDSGSDLWIADRDGTNRRRLYEHEQPSALVRFPAWVDDGRIAAVIQTLTVRNGVTHAQYTAQVIDVATGERRKVVDGAVALGASPGSDRLLIVRVAADGSEELVSVPVDGGEAQVLVPSSEGLIPIGYPRYSPDGASVAFAAAESALGGIPAAGGARNGVDGPPQDIWMVDAGGGPVRRVADLKEDSPAPAWDRSGKHIYVLGGIALYEVNVRNGSIVRIGDGAFHGQLEWAPGP